ELGAGGNGDDNLSFLLGGFDDLVPFVLRRLPGLPLDNIAAQHRAGEANDKQQQFHALPQKGVYSPKSFRATAAPGFLTLLFLSSDWFSNLLNCSRVNGTSFAAMIPNSLSHFVSISRRLVPTPMPLEKISCPSRLNSQLTKTLVALGCG